MESFQQIQGIRIKFYDDASLFLSTGKTRTGVWLLCDALKHMTSEKGLRVSNLIDMKVF